MRVLLWVRHHHAATAVVSSRRRSEAAARSASAAERFSKSSVRRRARRITEQYLRKTHDPLISTCNNRVKKLLCVNVTAKSISGSNQERSSCICQRHLRFADNICVLSTAPSA